MSLLAPLGLLGLIGIIALIIIYIIKPNYQNKFISSTFIWKLSLKYKKKKIPINKLRNILLFLCQILFISMAAMILARPIIAEERAPDMTEKVIIIDASVSMLSSTQSETRFERAVERARDEVNRTLEDGGTVSIILASEKAEFIVREAGADNRININSDLDSLANIRENNPCTYGSGDIEGAILLAETITAEREGVDVILYTDTNYIDSGRVKVEDVSDPMEWNAAILDIRAIYFENYYRFEVDVACYGNVDRDIMLYLDVKDINGGSEDISIQTKVRCMSGEVVTLIYANSDKYPDETLDEDIKVFQYQSVSARVEANDSFSHDNTYYLYGGSKHPLSIQYCSPIPNNFYTTALMVVRDQFGDTWDIDVKEVDSLDNAANKGFDIYIYEHEVPKTLPTDGIVIISDPDSIPSSTGLKLASSQRCDETPLSEMDPHVLMYGVTPSNITLTKYTPVLQYEGYTPLMGVGSMPVVLAKNEPHQKIVLLSFSLHYSNLPVLLDFPLLLSNILDYYAPPAITEHVLEVNSSISLNARSDELTLVGPATNVSIKEFPSAFTAKEPGVYTVSQRLVSDEQLVDTFFVKIPQNESNTEATEDVLKNPLFIEKKEIEDIDLVMYFAIMMTLLLFAEWWLHSREQF